MQWGVSYEDTSLPQLVNLLNSLDEIYISPGLALDEISSNYTEITSRLFEDFFLKYLPTYRDAHNFLPAKLDRKQILRFFDLPTFQQAIMANAYACFLSMFYINKEYPFLPQQEKFKLLLNVLIKETKLLDSTACFTAIYCFSNNVHGSNKVSIFKKNFFKTKRPRNGVIKEIQNSLNAARDIINFKLIANTECYSLSHNANIKPIDAWFITEDYGMKLFSDLLCFKNGDQGTVEIMCAEELFSDEIVKKNYSYFLQLIITRQLLGEHKSVSTEKSLALTKFYINRIEEMFLK